MMGEYIETMAAVDILILGAGWTATHLIPMLESERITYAATTTTGRDNTIPFRFDPNSSDGEPFRVLPDAKTILITFPLKGKGASARVFQLYDATHPDSRPRWIQLGSTGIYKERGWSTHTSPYDRSNERAVAEDELLAHAPATVLNLSGLYDDQARKPRNWVSRVARTKQDVEGKQSLHLIHGNDVARGILGCHRHFERVKGQRWILTDLFVYDWWALMMDWGGRLQDGSMLRTVVTELMEECTVRALPRPPDRLGRALDARDFWKAIDDAPQEGSVLSRPQ